MSTFFVPALNVEPTPPIFFQGAPAIGVESKKIGDLIEDCLSQYLIPVSRQTGNLSIKFDRLKFKWQEETAFLSSITDIAMHPAYQQIIGLGEDVLPFIMNELSSKPNHWFWALKAITGVDPVPHEKRGNIEAMTDEWIKWWNNR
jgi:hypothetical protein